MSYIVSKGGTFGTVQRRYRTMEGVPMVIIRWGILGWITPVATADTKVLSSAYESEARQQAVEWVDGLEMKP